MKAKRMLLLLIFSSFVVFQCQAIMKLFLENRYGAPLMFKVHNNNKTNPNKPMNKQETTLHNQNQQWLGTVPCDATKQTEWVNYLEIKTAHYYSSYVSLEKYLDQICRQLHMNKQHANEDAVLVIYPSSMMSDWHIEIEWRRPTYAI